MERTVQCAVETFQQTGSSDGWAVRSSSERGRILQRMAEILKNNMEELCWLEALDTGIPISQIRDYHLPAAIGTLQYYAALATCGFAGRIMDTPEAGMDILAFSQSIYWRDTLFLFCLFVSISYMHLFLSFFRPNWISLGGHHDSFSYTRREPLGVCVAISGWNYPLVTMMWKIAPALACGNTVIFKPSECTPLTAWKVVSELWHKDESSLRLPCGALQVLLGEAETAQALVSHPAVAKVSLTGSVGTGIHVARQSAETMKHLTLELGGKSPIGVSED